MYAPTNSSLTMTQPNKHSGDNIVNKLCKHTRTYLNQPPIRLPKYLAEFATPATEVKDGPVIETCRGVGNHTHPFLAADGFARCKGCNEVVCRHCESKIDEQTYCLLCYAQESLVPIPGEKSSKPVNEMRNELAQHYNFDGVDALTMEEVEDYYEVKEVVNSRAKKLIDEVPFPVYPSKAMETDECWTTVIDINLAQGGAFLADPTLDFKFIPGIIEFFASLVRFKSMKRTDHIKDSPIYDAMPELFIEFAEKSRVDSGYRLLGRTVRHSYDSRISPMEDCMAKLIMDNSGDIGIQLCSEIPASMKKDVYETQVTATSKNLLCCKCTCHCGSQDNERVACVHTPVRLYSLSMMLHEDLAEHILLELTARVGGCTRSGSINSEIDVAEVPTWMDEDPVQMKNDIMVLMEAAGETVSKDEATKKCLRDLLQVFVVGTERRK